MDARNLNVLFVGLGSIGTRHLQNLTTIAKKRGYGLQIDALRSSIARSLRPGVEPLLRRQYLDPEQVGQRHCDLA